MWWNVQDAYDMLHCHNYPDNREDCDCGGHYFQPCSFGCVLEDKNLIVMQFTGLKDKNGKEIYEDDILVEIYDYPTPNGYKPKPFKFPSYEIFYGGGYEESVYGIGYCFDGCDPEMDKCEVIGNIHQNPDLLK